MKQVAYVGVAHIHTPKFVEILNNRPEFAVKAVWDAQPARAQLVAEKLNSTSVADLSEILDDSDIEAVVICAETNTQAQLVEAAVAADKHLFVEKPLGISGDSAYRMARAIDEAGLIFQTGYFMRGFGTHRFIKQQLEAGTLGKITRVRHATVHQGALEGWFEQGWFEDGWMWMTDPAQAGIGAFGDLGTHSLDILMWLLGDVQQVTAQIDTALHRYQCDEYGEGLLRFTNGVIGTIAAGWVDVQNTLPVYVSGTEGQIYVNADQLYFKSQHVEGADGQQPWTSLPEDLPHAFELFLDALLGQDVPLVTPYEAAARTAVIEALYQAAQENAWVEPFRQ